MKDFEIRCDESRLEKNNTLYGKFSLGPFLPGQGTTFGNALRRSLLSELSGLGITAFEIIGVMQEFSTLPGLRESVLDLSLNLKQIVLTGVLPFSTPPIGFLKVRGPAIIYAADLKLPAGVYCAAPKQYIGTLASNGVLNLKFLISVGKGHSTQPYSLYRSLSKVKLQPWKRESMFSSNSINKGSDLHRPEVKNDATLFDDEWKNSNWKNHSLLASSSIVDGGHEYSAHLNSVAEVDKTRRISPPTGGRTVQKISCTPSTMEEGAKDMQSSPNSRIANVNQDILTKSIDSRELESTNKKTINSIASPIHPTSIRELELKRQKVFNTEILNNTTTYAPAVQSGEAESANYEKKGAIFAEHENSCEARSELKSKGDIGSANRYIDSAQCTMPLGGKGAKVHVNRELNKKTALNNDSELGLETNGGIKYVNIQKQTFQRVNPHQVLPIDAVFTPVSQVNFLTQVNDRFETPRENVVLEIWTNGSIHPKRALEEAALSLVQNFDTLLKNIQQASSFQKGLRYSNSFQFLNEKSNVRGNTSGVTKEHKENLIKKTPSIISKFNLADVPLHQPIYNLDIGNLDLSLETFILLKQAKIKNLAHLLKNLYSKEGKFFVKVEESTFQHNLIYKRSVGGVGCAIDKKKNCSEEESAINNMDLRGGYLGQTKLEGESFSNVCLNEKIIEELSNTFSQLGIY